MTTRRTFTAAELAQLFKRLAREPDFAVELAPGFRAVQMAEKSGLKFKIERNGTEQSLADSAAAELEEISGLLWDKIGAFLSSIEDELTPDALKPEPDDPDLVPDPLGLTPDSLREKKDPLEGTVESLLTPMELRDKEHVQ